jgi:putative endonuclease
MGKTWRWYVYIALCGDGSYYVGLTWDLGKREDQHKSGKGSKYTARRGFVRIVYAEVFEDFSEARKREKQLQGWTRAKKEKLIKGEWKQSW